MLTGFCQKHLHSVMLKLYISICYTLSNRLATRFFLREYLQKVGIVKKYCMQTSISKVLFIWLVCYFISTWFRSSWPLCRYDSYKLITSLDARTPPWSSCQYIATHAAAPLPPPFPHRKWIRTLIEFSRSLASDRRHLIGTEVTGLRQRALQGGSAENTVCKHPPIHDKPRPGFLDSDNQLQWLKEAQQQIYFTRGSWLVGRDKHARVERDLYAECWLIFLRGEHKHPM